MKDGNKVEEVVEILEELKDEGSVPRNVKDKLINTISALKEDQELKIRLNKALHELDEIADDPNLETYTRSQIWNVVSLLENIE